VAAPRILAVGHDASRAGAQVALLHLARWLAESGRVDPLVLLRRDGVMRPEYEQAVPTFVAGIAGGESTERGTEGSLRSRVTAWLGRPSTGPRAIPRRLAGAPIRLIYVNSVASLDLLEPLRAAWPVPVLCHVHELEMSIRRFCGLDVFRRAQGHVDAFVAVSEAVRRNLLEGHGVAPGRVHLVYEGLTLPEEARAAVAGETAAVRNRLRLPADAFVVGGCGTLDWRKGPDLFLQTAALVRAHQPARPIHFVWVGANSAAREHDVFHHDLERAQLGDRVHVIGVDPDPRKYFGLFDVFLLTSREDPFPLVCLEAASFGVPTVCFAAAGGMPEFVGKEAGLVVPYLDLPAVARAVLELAHDEPRRAALGARALEKVWQHHDIRVIGRQIERLILELIAATPARARHRRRRR
jgi:glycosyltransferase involved in cell wall biosynthesis